MKGGSRNHGLPFLGFRDQALSSAVLGSNATPQAEPEKDTLLYALECRSTLWLRNLTQFLTSLVGTQQCPTTAPSADSTKAQLLRLDQQEVLICLKVPKLRYRVEPEP